MTTPTTAGITSGAPRGTALPAGYPLAEARIALQPVVGELQLRMSDIGQGKSADAYTVVPALAQHGVVLFAHTDGSPGPQVRALGLTGAGANTAVADRVRITRVLHPQRIAVLLYRAVSASVRTGAALPVAVVVDEIGHIIWPGGQSPTVGSELNRTAELLLAVARCDLQRVGELVDLPYSTWAGEPAPDLTGHGIAVIGYSTLSRPLGGYATDGQPDMARVPPTRLAMSASSIILLERTGGSESGRGRFVVAKSRLGGAPAEVEMRFDSAAGYRPRWSDVA